MALGQSPSIVTNGLVFAYDVNSQKSYKGPPLRNHIQTLSPIASTATGKVVTTGSEIVNIPTVAEMTTQFVNFQNTGASDCCVSFMNYGNAGNIFTGSTLYTYLILHRSDSGYTHPNYMYRYEYNSSGTYQTESGVYNTSQRTYLGNGWYYAWGTFTTQAATTQLQCYSFNYNYSSFNDKISVAKICILPGNYSGLHPRYWPDTNTTRSSTQTILDLTNNNTWTVNNLSYASDGTFSFNGSSSWIESSTSSVFDSQSITMESWNKPNSTVYQNGFLFEKGQVNTQYSNFYNSDGTFYFRTMGLSPQDLTFSAPSYISPGNWYHIVCTVGSGTKTIYINGVQITQTSYTGTIPTGQTNQYVGKYGSGGNQYPFNGSIAVSRVYNRALSPSEVAQNFAAQRGIYGV